MQTNYPIKQNTKGEYYIEGKQGQPVNGIFAKTRKELEALKGYRERLISFHDHQ